MRNDILFGLFGLVYDAGLVLTAIGANTLSVIC